MQIKTDSYDVGVIIGRFQVPELHDAHKELINTVYKEHERVLIFLGLSEIKGTINNPLDFEMRKQVILDVFPNVDIHYIHDRHNDEVWSKSVDKQIGRLCKPKQTVVLYGGRDSFIRHYNGVYDCRELESETIVSATEIRKKISNKVKDDPIFRMGAIWQSDNRFPTSFQTVDIGIFDETYEHIWLGKKEGEEAYRLIGGFVDPRDKSLEHCARREAYEETGLEVIDVVYIGSFRTPDWRYEGEADAVMTALFAGKRQQGIAKAADDVQEVKKFKVESLTDHMIMPNHRPFVRELIKYALDKHANIEANKAMGPMIAS